MLDDLEANVDTTDSKLQKNLKRLKKFVRETEGEFRGRGNRLCFYSVWLFRRNVAVADYILLPVHLANNL